jgi:hypothetical protein
LDPATDSAYHLPSLFRCPTSHRCIVSIRCDGLIILQAEDLATSESLVLGNRNRGWDRGMEEIRFSELYMPIASGNDSLVRSQADRKGNNRCDGLIRSQAGNLANGESPVPGNRKRVWESRDIGHSIF